MKFALLFLLPILAQANTVDSVYKTNSALPTELKQRVLAQVESKCARGVSRYSLTEENTNVREDRVDQGIHDFYYTTTFRTTYYFDGMHPTFAYITVESAEFDINNPAFDRFDIKSISADAANVCE